MEKSKILFTWFDYTIFSIVLVLSSLIGLYFGFFGKKPNTTREYLLGGKTMKVFPVAMSLIASYDSGLTLLALPAEVYQFGASYWITCFSLVFVCLMTSYVFLPVYYKLELTSTYEYLNLRFDGKTRTVSSLLFVLNMLLYIPLIIYVPALAFSQATELNIHVIIPVICSICIFYTTIGGLKAVVWSDTLQFFFTFGATLAILILGLKSTGGVNNLWKTSTRGQRLDVFDFDVDPTKKDSFWALLIGQTFAWTSIISTSPAFVQKFLAVPTLKDARKVVSIFYVGYSIIISCSMIIGLIVYTKYYDCDPVMAERIRSVDQIVPNYVLETAENIPGLSGLFIAGIFSATLSTFSAFLNTIGGAIYQDFISGRMAEDTTEKRASDVIKVIVVISGVVCTVLVFVIEHLGNLLPLTIAFCSLTQGPMVGLFILGLLFPMANFKGAFWGGIIGVITSSIMIFGAQYYKLINAFEYPTKPMDISGCHQNFTFNSTLKNDLMDVKPLMIFRISYYYYALVGASITIIAGLLISVLTNRSKRCEVNRDLLSPVIYFLLPSDKNKENVLITGNNIEMN